MPEGYSEISHDVIKATKDVAVVTANVSAFSMLYARGRFLIDGEIYFVKLNTSRQAVIAAANPD